MSQTRWSRLAELPRRPKVLLLEDQVAVIETVNQAIGADCQVFIAPNPLSAVALCTEKLPDLILLDYEMLGDSGLQAVAQLRELHTLQRIPLIFISSDTESLFESFEIDDGAIDFVAKPVNTALLRSRVTTFLLLNFYSAQLNTLTFRDGLTGAYNRSYFEEQIGIECARAQRSSSFLSLMSVDIDRLKTYNAQYGRQAGDDTLRLVARVLESLVRRPGDLVARYDSDEFLCLLPATDFEPAMQLAERIEQEIRARGLGHTASADSPEATVSVGLATRRRALDGGPDALLRLAREQLDQAKQRGGARVCGKVLYRAAGA